MIWINAFPLTGFVIKSIKPELIVLSFLCSETKDGLNTL